MKLLTKKRIINNDEYKKAQSNIDNRKILNTFYKKYSNALDIDEIYRCGMIALWKTLQLHDDTRQKFTTSLYRFMVWECNQAILQKRKTYIEYSSYDYINTLTYDHTFKFADNNIEDCISILKPIEQNIINDYLNNESILNISLKYNMKENKIKRILKLIRSKIENFVYN